MNDPRLLQMSTFLIDCPFADRLFTGAQRAIEHLRRFSPTVILSDGDVVFQPRKLQRSGSVKPSMSACDRNHIASYPPADITLERIGNLADVDLPASLGQRPAGV